MQRPTLAAAPRALALFVAAASTSVAHPAQAADPNVEKQAMALQKKAIEEDNLNLAYPEAIKKLATAISRCGEDKCNPALKGALYRDLGAVLILSGSVEEGRAAFAKALSFDPSLELDPAYRNPTLEGYWRESQKKAGVGGRGEGTSAAPEGNGAPGPEPGAQPSGGDFAHVPAGAQLVRTPLPVYAEYLGSEKVVRVVVRYKPPGSTEWKSLDLRKIDGGYGGLIPCADVTEGVLQYYLEGFAGSDEAVAAAGSRNKPFSVPIKPQLAGPAPALPGQQAPKQCAETASAGGEAGNTEGKGLGDDCDRNAQCQSGACTGGKCVESGAGEGEDCQSDDDCASGTCADGRCTSPKKLSGDSCEGDDECASGSCRDGRCTEERGRRGVGAPRVWIGVTGSLDFFVLPGASDVCVLNNNNPPSPLNQAGYECVDPSGHNFPGTSAALNMSISRGVGDSVAGGFSTGTARILASFDYALSANVLVGARAGYVFFTDPASAPGRAFAPVHLEARLTYLIGKNALSSTVAPLLLLGAGLGEFDASFGVQVVTTNNNQPQNENAWLVAGPFFGAAGAGVRLLLGPNIAATAAVKAEGAFGGTAGFLFGLAPEIGLQLGL